MMEDGAGKVVQDLKGYPTVLHKFSQYFFSNEHVKVKITLFPWIFITLLLNFVLLIFHLCINIYVPM